MRTFLFLFLLFLFSSISLAEEIELLMCDAKFIVNQEVSLSKKFTFKISDCTPKNACFIEDFGKIYDSHYSAYHTRQCEFTGLENECSTTLLLTNGDYAHVFARGTIYHESKFQNVTIRGVSNGRTGWGRSVYAHVDCKRTLTHKRLNDTSY